MISADVSFAEAEIVRRRLSPSLLNLWGYLPYRALEAFKFLKISLRTSINLVGTEFFKGTSQFVQPGKLFNSVWSWQRFLVQLQFGCCYKSTNHAQVGGNIKEIVGRIVGTVTRGRSGLRLHCTRPRIRLRRLSSVAKWFSFVKGIKVNSYEVHVGRGHPSRYDRERFDKVGHEPAGLVGVGDLRLQGEM
jgi:hypothetical protein